MKLGAPSTNATLIGACLFILGAWPAFLWEPPLQDLPLHMAASELLLHPEHAYDLVPNGAFRTNALCHTFMQLVGNLVGVPAAGRIFVIAALALVALAIPRFVRAFVGSRRMWTAAFLAGPLVHNWCVCAGFVNYVVAFGLSLLLLIALRSQRRAPSFSLGAQIAALALLTWYAHSVALVIVCSLISVEWLSLGWAQKLRALRTILVPLLPAGGLILWSALLHGDGSQLPSNPTTWLSPLELIVVYWKYGFGGFTWLSVPGAALAFALLGFALKSPARGVALMGARGATFLMAAYVLLPSYASRWAFLNVRVLPFLMASLLLCVPKVLGRRDKWLLGAVSVLVSLALGIDYHRLDQDRRHYMAGVDAVPEGAALLPLTFVTARSSTNTQSLANAWGYYVVARHTEAPLMGADSKLYPWLRPKGQSFVARIAGGAPEYRAADCDIEDYAFTTRAECRLVWLDGWVGYFTLAAQHYDTLLLWEAPEPVILGATSRYEQSYRDADLVIMHRR